MSHYRGCVRKKEVKVDRDGVVGRHYVPYARERGSFYCSGKGQDQFVCLKINGRSELDRQTLLTERHDTREDVHKVSDDGPMIERRLVMLVMVSLSFPAQKAEQADPISKLTRSRWPPC